VASTAERKEGMAIRSDEIVQHHQETTIENFDAGAESRSIGTVVERLADGIAQIYGLSGALSSELLEFPGDVMGMASELEEETVGAVILGDPIHIKEGDTVKTPVASSKYPWASVCSAAS